MNTEINPQELKLYYEPKDRLRLTVGDNRSYPTVRPAWAAPLSHPGKHLALLDGKGNEIVMLESAELLPGDSKSAVMQELSRRYLTATVATILHAKGEFGATYWHVVTDRGERDFVTQSLQENAQWLSPNHLLLTDVDGNRFELPDIESMDARSRMYVETIL